MLVNQLKFFAISVRFHFSEIEVIGLEEADFWKPVILVPLAIFFLALCIYALK